MKKQITKKSLIKKSIIIAIMLAITVVLHILKDNPAVCEWFATNFARWWIFFFGNLFGILPISAYELFLGAFIVYCIVYIVFLIKNLAKKWFLKAISLTLTFFVVVSSIVALYTATATMSYNRKPLPIPLYEYEPKNLELTLEQAEGLVSTVIQNLNTLMNTVDRDEIGDTKFPFNIQKLGEIVGKDYDRVFVNSNYFSPYTVKVKPILNKRLMSELAIYGVFFAPAGVATVNPYTPNYYMPVTVAHEIAHGKGVMYESDANLVAYYVCLQSTNDYVRYSAYCSIYYFAISILLAYENTVDKINDYYNLIGNQLYVESANNRKLWAQFTLLNDVGEFFNDIYLKLQGQDNGTDSYDDGKIPESEVIENDDGTTTIKIVYLSEVQRMLIQMYLEGRLRLIG